MLRWRGGRPVLDVGIVVVFEVGDIVWILLVMLLLLLRLVCR